MADCTCGIASSTIVVADSYTHFHGDHPGHSDGRIPASLLESIKTCSKLKDLYGGNRLHAVVIKQGLLDKDSYVGTALLHMYAKCGKLMKAVEVFDQLPERDVAAWNALITGYTQHGLGHEALGCFERMEDEGLTPSIITYVSLLKACGSIGALKKGARIHAEVQRLGILHTNAMICTALVDMYAKCGALDKAQAVFDEFPIRALATWNALLFGYAEQGLLNEALSLFQHMQEEGLSPDAITYVCMLKVCTNARSIERGIEIHTELSKKHMLENNVIIGTALIEMYANCGALDKAQEVFDKLQKKDVACWTALIGGFARHGIGDKSINCYIRMQEEGFSPSAITLVFVLSACGSSQAIEMGQLVHAEIRKQRAFAENTLIANALVDMYFKCSDVQKAKEVFDEIPVKITGSWNTLITGYVDHGLAEEALKCFENMQDNGFLPDAITFICILKACSELKALEKGEKVHAEVSKLGLLKNHIVLGNALVDMYIKCNMLERAKEVFEKVLSRDVTSWNVLIAGYAQHKFNDKAMECFGQMLSEGISPNSITFQSALKACGSVGALQKGKELHGRVGMISSCNRINGLVNALMDMYAQCGAFENAWELFGELQTRDVASWNILISGYVQHGFGSEALDCFARMQKDDVFPNVVTYVNILKACSAIGEVKKGEEIHMEIERLGLLNEHYILGTALVDMYAKHGFIKKSQEVFDKLLLRDAVCWTALINGYA